MAMDGTRHTNDIGETDGFAVLDQLDELLGRANEFVDATLDQRPTIGSLCAHCEKRKMEPGDFVEIGPNGRTTRCVHYNK